MREGQRRAAWHVRLLVAVTVLSVAGCGSNSANGRSGQAASAMPRHSSSAAPDGHASAAGGDVAAGKSACELISAGDAAAALGMAVGKGRPSPGVDLASKAVGGGCSWSDSAGGTAVVVTLRYPSPAVASKLFKSSAAGSVPGAVPGAKPLHLPDLGLPEAGDTGVYNGTRIAESFALDSNRELDVTINEPASGPGSSFSIAAFVTFFQQAVAAWR